MARRRLSTRTKWIAAVVVVVLAVGALLLFQPWLLFVNTSVDEALPTAAPSPTASASPSTSPSTSSSPSSSPSTSAATKSSSPSPTAPAGPVVLRRGTFVSHEHHTTGTALIIQLPDGSRILRLEDLDTSSGPQVEVWLSNQPVIDGRDGWFVFKDGYHVSLGDIKGNQGNQNYPIPADVNLDRITSVSLWCARFFVSFGAAELAPV